MINLPFTTHPAYQLDSLAFAYIRDAKGVNILRVQADTVEDANEIAETICLWSNQMNIQKDKKDNATVTR